MGSKKDLQQQITNLENKIYQLELQTTIKRFNNKSIMAFGPSSEYYELKNVIEAILDYLNVDIEKIPPIREKTHIIAREKGIMNEKEADATKD